MSSAFAPVAEAAGKKERTLIGVKPNGVQRGQISAVIERFEKRGFKLVAIKFMQPTLGIIEKHYAEHSAKSWFKSLCDVALSAPWCVMVSFLHEL